MAKDEKKDYTLNKEEISSDNVQNIGLTIDDLDKSSEEAVK